MAPTFPLSKRFYIVVKYSLDFLNVLHTKKKNGWYSKGNWEIKKISSKEMVLKVLCWHLVP